jgi:hypothetical protein
MILLYFAIIARDLRRFSAERPGIWPGLLVRPVGVSPIGPESLKDNLLNYFRALRSNRVMLGTPTNRTR